MEANHLLRMLHGHGSRDMSLRMTHANVSYLCPVSMRRVWPSTLTVETYWPRKSDASVL